MPSLLHSNRFMRTVAACVGAVLITAIATFIPLSAASKEPAKSGKATKTTISDATTQGDEGDGDGGGLPSRGENQRIRLNYLKASWKKVLTDLAKSLDKELVVDELPAKSYSRLDRKFHSPDEAMRIINRELAAFGLKVVVKGEHLVVINVRQSRMDYTPAVIKSEPFGSQSSADDGEEDESDPPPVAKKKRRPAPVQNVWPADQRDDEVTETPKRLPSRSRNIRTASADEEDAAPQRPARRAQKAYSDDDSADNDVTETIVQLGNRDVRSVEKMLLKAFRGNTQKLSRGPGGFEGFSVQTPEDEVGGKRIRFRVGIDEERNVLVIEATKREAEAVGRLIKALDKLPSGENGAIRTVSSKKANKSMAKSLQAGFDQLAFATRAHLAQAGADEEDGDADQEEQPARPRGRQFNIGGQNRGEGTVGGLVGMPSAALQGSLKGEVSIEAVPDLNIFIIRGNEKDVETVMAILKEIEKLSEASAPQVRMQLVDNQNSEALASLLTSVYDRISPTRSARGGQASGSNVAVFPVARPNALLIVAPQADMQAILDLLDELDQPSDPKMEFRVFRLKYAIPTLVVDTIKEMYPVGQTTTPGQGGAGAAGGANNNNQNSSAVLAPRVVVVADTRTNSVIIQARPRDLAEVTLLIKDLDAIGSDSVNQLRIFPLTNAVADELAATLQQSFLSVLAPARVQQNIQGGGGNFGGGGGQNQQIQNEDLREVKSSIIEFIDADGEEGRAVRSGLISDIRISADSRTNSIVVTAPRESVNLIATLIDRLDKPAAAVAEIKVFPLSNADASGMVTLLEGLFSNQTQRQRAGAGGNQGQAGGGLQLAGTDDASSSLIPLRFSVDTRTNSIIAIGGAEALRVVHAVLLSLDSSDVRQRQNRVYSLKNSPAADVAAAIQNFLNSRRQIEQQNPDLISNFDQFDREVVVVPEPVGNKLLISATPRYFNDIIKMVKELDQVPKQVIIQALLVEVELTSNDEWGVELGVQDSILFDRSAISSLTQVPITTTSPNGVQTTTQTIVSQSSTPGYAFNSTDPLGNNTSPNLNTRRIGPQALSNLAVGRVNGDLGYGGLVLAAGSESVSVLLRALAARRRIDVLSRPQVQALDNQLATIQVGQEVPRVNSFTINQNNGNATPLVQPRNVGIILEVIPRISPDGMVVMEVSARKDALNPQGVPLFTNPNGSVITSPIIDTTNAQTSVIVRTGQTIVLGGMITSSNTKEERKVPLLGDIPVLGQLFRADFKRTRRTELLIFLTPRIIRNEEEAELIKEIETQRINFIECEAESIHGPLFGVPAEEFQGFPQTDEGMESENVPPAPRSRKSRSGRMTPPPPDADPELSEPLSLKGSRNSSSKKNRSDSTRVQVARKSQAELSVASAEFEEADEFQDFSIQTVRKEGRQKPAARETNEAYDDVTGRVSVPTKSSSNRRR